MISGNTTYGVGISDTGTSGNLVEGDYIGTDLTGKVAIANDTGVEIRSGANANSIGGTTSGAGNLISGNTEVGVDISGRGSLGNETSSDNVVEGT